MRLTRKSGLLAAASALAVVAALTPAGPALAEDTGFWYGADGAGPGPANSAAPYQEPSCGSGHMYGGYIGKIGGADLVSASNTTGYGPGHTGAWNSTYAADANANHFNYHPEHGVGTGGYWFMFGPGATDGTGLGAYAWGQRQGQWALGDWQRWYANGTHRMPFQILWMDVEKPGFYGWGSDGGANRQVFNGFWDYVTNAKQGPVPGVYSTAAQWNEIMAGNTSIPNTWEWTAQTSRAAQPSPCPTSFSGTGQSAVFFGGQNASSAHAAMWQWSLSNTADYDQIDSNKNIPD